jgi:hypothetical protein
MSDRKYLLAKNPEPNQPDLRLIYSQTKVMYVRNLGFLGAIKEAAELVPFTLKNPTSIFEGLRPPDDKHSGESPGWLCYCSRPFFDYTKSGEECDPAFNKVFLVFVNDEKVVFNWRWDNADTEALDHKEYLPENYKTRFRKQIL